MTSARESGAAVAESLAGIHGARVCAGGRGTAGARGADRAGQWDSDERVRGEAARRRRCRSRRRLEHLPPELPLAAPAPAMETLNGPAGSGASDAKPQPPNQHHRHHHLHPLAERRRLHRAPSPARPFLKDLHTRAPAPGPAPANPSSGRAPAPAAPRSPSLAGKAAPSPGSLAAPGRLSRRSGGVPGAKDKPPPGAGARVPGGAKAVPGTRRAARAVPAEPLPRTGRAPGTESLPAAAKGRKAKRGSGAPATRAIGPLSPATPVPAVTLSVTSVAGSLAPGLRISHTDSSSDLSDCPSEPLSDEQRLLPAASSDAESGTGSSDREPQRGAPAPSSAARGMPPASPEPPALLAAPPVAGACLAGRSSPGGVAPGSSGLGAAEDFGGRAPPERAVPGTPKEPSPSEQPRLLPVPVVEEEELLREMEELRSENDYLKVSSGLGCRCRCRGDLPFPERLAVSAPPPPLPALPPGASQVLYSFCSVFSCPRTH